MGGWGGRIVIGTELIITVMGMINRPLFGEGILPPGPGILQALDHN